MTEPLYLDAAASTPLDPRVLDRMLPVLRDQHGNPSSGHWAGRRAHQLVEEAREQVAALVQRPPRGVIFTGGATESNNLALRGLLTPTTSRRVVVSCITEHPAVLEPLRGLATSGITVRLVGVDETGRPDLDDLEAAVDEDVVLVSVMAANNETGTVADLQAIAAIAHAAGAWMHTDASQLLAWGPLPNGCEPDLITVSGHKMHGPQGVGALVVTREVARSLQPLVGGGGQERGLRSGTVNVAGVVGLGAAAQLALAEGPAAAPAVRAQRDALLAGLQAQLPVALLNGHPKHRLPGLLNVAFGDRGDEVDADAVLAHMPSVAAATGSACSHGAPGPSHVLTASGLARERAESSLRFSLSRLSAPDTAARALPRIVSAVREVRRRRDASTPWRSREELVTL